MLLCDVLCMHTWSAAAWRERWASERRAATNRSAHAQHNAVSQATCCTREGGEPASVDARRANMAVLQLGSAWCDSARDRCIVMTVGKEEQLCCALAGHASW
jgi:hypothetical protein